MTLAKIVAANLKSNRVRRGLTQEGFARAAKISVSYVSMLERGTRIPPLEMIDELAKALGVKALDMLRR